MTMDGTAIQLPNSIIRTLNRETGTTAQPYRRLVRGE
jgi:hypothetical protein